MATYDATETHKHVKPEMMDCFQEALAAPAAPAEKPLTSKSILTTIGTKGTGRKNLVLIGNPKDSI